MGNGATIRGRQVSALIFAGAMLFTPPALPGPPPIPPLSTTIPAHPAPSVAIFAPGSAAIVQSPAGGVAPAAAQAQTPSDSGAQSPSPDIVITGKAEWEAPDPLAGINQMAFDATMAVDKAVIGPISLAYKNTLPEPVRDGIHNFLYNMREPVVFLNFVLQLKFGRALETAARFVINTTVGVAGLFDIAKRKPFRWKRRSNGFTNTLGFYGVKSGPFLFLPIVGPTTPRDLIGGAIDRLIFPFVYGSRVTKPEVAVPLGVLGVLDHRAEFDETQHQLHDGQADPYARSRDFYLQRRQNEIDELKGKAPRNSSPMSEAPTAPIEVRKRSSEISAEEAPPAAAPRITPPPVVRTLPEATQPAVSEPPAPAPGPVLPQGA